MNHTVLNIYGPRARVFHDRALSKFEAKPHDAGLDLIPYFEHTNHITVKYYACYDVWSIPTGVHLMPEPGWQVMIKSRSSTPDRLAGCSVIMDTIDAGYTGEIKIRLAIPNSSSLEQRKAIQFQLLEELNFCQESLIGVAQAVILPVPSMILHLLDELPLTARGSSGFGSTDQPKKAS